MSCAKLELEIEMDLELAMDDNCRKIGLLFF